MGDVEELKVGIIKALDTLEVSIQSINKKEYSQRPKLIRRCENQAADIETKIQSFDLEILYLDNKKLSDPYKAALKEIQARLAKVKIDLEFKKKERESEGTLEGELMKKKALEGDDAGGNVMIQIGDKIQQKGMESLQRTLALVKASNQIADEISLELFRQLEQLENTTAAVKDTKSEVNKANQYIKYFAKEMYTDKIIMGLILLCILAVVSIIVLKLTGGKSGTTDSGKPIDDTIESFNRIFM